MGRHRVNAENKHGGYWEGVRLMQEIKTGSIENTGLMQKIKTGVSETQG